MRQLLAILLMLAPISIGAQSLINLTPRPYNLQRSSGSYTLPQDISVGGAALPDSIVREAQKFVDLFNRAATGSSARLNTQSQGATITLEHDAKLLSSLGPEGYRLSIKPEGITAVSATARGMFYALTSLRKMLPADIASGVKDHQSKAYTLPLLTITDKPRYRYRGFMLDVARHFFSVEEVKRIIDLMALYKMNTFHFHLTDDQGWRWEVKRYPLLSQVGSIAANSYMNAYQEGALYTNAQYGPYFYTQEQLRDIVAYAQERHINIVPEIDMPGHFVAALVAYPEYSCAPEASRSVWINGGVSTDVLNVANPAAVQFAKNILDELMDIFPSPTIHIGGDECPTTAWEKNAQCQARYRELKLTNYHQLQSHFIKEIDEHVKQRGRTLALWNEAITANGADTKLIKSTKATIYCWTGADPAARKAAELQLPHIYTPQRPYYINRQAGRGAAWEESLPGDGSDNLQAVYNVAPPQNPYTLGLQATFWTEHVGTNETLEYLMLPRLMAVAEAAWTPQAQRQFTDFQARMKADTPLLDLAGFKYERFFLDPEPTTTPPTNEHPTTLPQVGKTYLLQCAVEGFKQTSLTDAQQGNALTHSTHPRATRAWVIAQAKDYVPSSHSLQVQLKNAATQRYIATSATTPTGTLGYPVSLNSNPAWITLTYVPTTGEYEVSTAGGRKLFPILGTSQALPSTVSSGSTTDYKNSQANAVRSQGAAWHLVQARRVTYTCTDTKGEALGNIVEYIPTTQEQVEPPHFAGYTLKSPQPSIQAGENELSFQLQYERQAYLLDITCQDSEGGLLKRDTLSLALHQIHKIVPPSFDYYHTTAQAETLRLTNDTSLVFTYTTEALPGVERVAEAIGEMQDGLSVLLYDVSANAPARAGYRSIAPSTGRVGRSGLIGGGATPFYTWTLQKKDSRYQLYNHATSKYLPSMVRSGNIIVSQQPGAYTFTRNADGNTWRVQDANGLWWDGSETGMTGWTSYGHAYRLHRYFVAPYFRVVLHSVKSDGTELQDPQTSLVRAGTGYTLVIPAFKDLPLQSVSHKAEDLESVKQHLDIRLTYGTPDAIATTPQAQPKQKGIYDLTGRRVQPTKPGLYIIDGQKVLLR